MNPNDVSKAMLLMVMCAMLCAILYGITYINAKVGDNGNRTIQASSADETSGTAAAPAAKKKR